MSTGSGNAPTVAVSGRTVQLSWPESTFSGGEAHPSYVVKRYESTGTAEQTIASGTCSGATATSPCTETAVPPGTWKYTVTPAAGSWRGTESAQITAVIAQPVLTLTPTLTTTPTTLSGSISSFIAGETLRFRLDNPTTGALVNGTVDGTATPTPVPAGGSAAVTVKLPAGTSDGSHTVYAVSASGDTDGTSVTVDNSAPPPPTVTSAPGKQTAALEATFTFTNTAAVATYRWSLDGGPYVTCTSPKTYTGLADGPHDFAVVALNTLGTTSDPATYDWKINSTPPTASISFPAAGTSVTSADYTAGCGTATAGDFCGTASQGPGPNPLVSVQVSLQRLGTGLYWNGATFGSATEIFHPVSTSNGWSNWTFGFPAGDFPGDDSYKLAANATNSVGNTGPTSTATFTVDNSAPAATTITATPPVTSASSSGTLSFTHAEAGVLLQCKLDGGAYSNCTSPTTYGSLAEGAHTFVVKAVDAAGNTGAETSYSWTVDTLAPVSPSFTSGPTGATTATTATFGFSHPEGVTFFCSLDGGPYSACTSPKTYSGLPDGGHVVSVQARDDVGNSSVPVTRSWKVDTTGPAVLLTFPQAGGSYNTTSYTAGCATAATADVCGTASDATTSVSDVKISMRRDSSGLYWNGTSFASASPMLFPATGTTGWTSAFGAANFASDGSYTVGAVGTDAVGNTTTATSAFTIDRVAPAAPTITSGPASATKLTTASVAFSGGETGLTFSCQFDGGGWSTCTSPKTYSGLSDGSHTVSVRSTDAAGNVSSTSTHTWTVDTVAPTAAVTFPVNGATYGAAGYTAGCAGAATGDICGTSSDTGGSGVNSVQMSLRQISSGLYWNGSAFASASEILLPATGTSSWVHGMVSTAFPADGSYTARAVVTDAALNTGSASSTFSLDRTPPADPVITSRPSDLTGLTSASFSFTAEAGATFSCSLDSAPATACSSPRSYSGLSQGTHTFSVVATDASGNSSGAATDSWTVDLTGPTSSATFPVAGGSYNNTSWDTGCSTAGTGDFCGTAADTGGGTVTGVQVSLLQVGTAKWWNGTGFTSNTEVLFSASGTASWSYAFSAGGFPSEGSYTLRARATDSLGNIGAVLATSITIDRTAPPAPTIASGPATPTNATTASLTFSQADVGVTFRCRLDGGAFTSCVSPATYSGLVDGSHTFQVRAVDSAGNTSASTSHSWIVDTVAPPLPTITSGPEAQTAATTATLAFTDAEAGVTFLCSLNGATAVTCTSPHPYSGISEGTQTFTVAARDPAGNVSAVATYTWRVDQTGPATSITFPADGGSYNNLAYGAGCGSADLCGTADDGSGSGVSSVSLSVRGHNGKYWDGVSNFSYTMETFHTATGTTNWSFVLPISSMGVGSYTIRVRATDLLGNIGAYTTSTFTIDRTAPPAPTITSTPTNPSNSSSPTFSFTDSEENVTFTCRLGNASWTACTSPHTFSGVADGSRVFEVRARDAASNLSTSATYTWTVDTAAPAAAITFPVAGVDYNAADYNAGCATAGTGDMCGTASDAGTGLDTVRISLRNTDSGLYWNGTSFASSSEVLLTPTGTTGWTLAFASANFPEADFALRVVATDEAGNTTSVTTAFASDNVAPPTPTITAAPAASTTSTSASFSFTNTEAGVTFRCRIDGAPYTTCTSPKTYSGLGAGSHTFDVTATDPAGNSSPAASHTWSAQPVHYLKTNSTGNTTSSATLPLGTAPPSLTTLYNYDTNRDSSAGLLLARSSGLAETDPVKIQKWNQSLASPLTLSGAAKIRLWSAMKAFDPTKAGAVAVGLYDCDSSATTCSSVATSTVTSSGSWSGGSNTWVVRDWSLGAVSRTMAAGRVLQVRVVTQAASADDMLFAYDTTAYPSALIFE